MFILLFDIEFSNGYRCHHFITLLYIYTVLMNCCGSVYATEKPTLSIIGMDESSIITTTTTTSTITKISPSTLSQSKPSSTIYIPSLDGPMNVHERNIHSSEHDIRFEDFFWNGSGDEPLTLSLKSNARLTMNGFVGRETFIKTATVIATVYVGDDSTENEEDPECTSANCDDEIPDIYFPLNKRFWLITSVFGHLTDDEIPLIQERLENVYRIAFTKQQSIHLGISNATVDGSDEQIGTTANETMPIIDNKQNPNSSMPILPTSVLKYENSINEPITVQSNITLKTSSESSSSSSSSSISTSKSNETIAPQLINTTFITKTQTNFNATHRQKRTPPSQSIDITQSIAHTTITNATPYIDTINKSKSIGLQKSIENSRIYGSKSTKIDRKYGAGGDAIIGRVKILIHNISVISNSDKDYLDDSMRAWSTQGNSSSESSMTADNQTEIIYTVFVNGIPVLATIAANDMKLMSQNEVSKILDKLILTKAEPYLKEPQATPLIPSSTQSTNHNKPVLAMIFQNPYILAFIVALILLIILLLMILMLVTGSKQQQQHHHTNRKGISKSAQTAQQSFLPPLPPAVMSHHQNNTSNIGHVQNHAIDENRQMRSNTQIQITPSMIRRQKNRQAETQITSLPNNDSVDGGNGDGGGDGGVDGFECERDHSFIIIPTSSKRTHHNKKVGTPTIYFPEPPPSSTPSSPNILHLSQSQSITDTSSTSDSSSIYYIKKHKSRRHHLYSKRPKSKNSLNQREYATITKKQIERARKKTKHKRNCLKGGNGNRIGVYESHIHDKQLSNSSSFNECKQQNPANRTAIIDDTSEAFSGKNSNLYEHIEAFNPIMVAKRKTLSQNQSSSMMHHDKKKTTNDVHTEYNVEDFEQNGMFRMRSTQLNATQLTRNDSNENGNTNTIKRNYSGDCHDDDAEQRNAAAANRKMLNKSIYDSVKYESDSKRKTGDDNESIGSFLSMTSVRSFPKCNVTESLNRILEPVSITYLDQYDEIEAIEAATSKVPRIVDTKVKIQPNKQQQQQHEQTKTNKIDDSDAVYFQRTKSDGADPGVIGPVAWQYHKKKMQAQDTMKPIKDPATTLNRYEGLLEGAISLYSIETTEYHTIETITKEEFPEAIIKKDFRGKSADVLTNPTTKTYRPFTAMPTKIGIEEPVIPPRGAWMNSATPSPMGRPLSADSRQNTPSKPNEPVKSSCSSSALHKR